MHRRFRRDGITGQTGVDPTLCAQGTSTVRTTDQASASKFHQGPRYRTASQAGCMAASSSCDPISTNTFCIAGASMYEHNKALLKPANVTQPSGYFRMGDLLVLTRRSGLFGQISR